MIAISQATSCDLQLILDLQYLAFQKEAEQYNDFLIEPLRQTIEDIRREYEHHTFLKATDENDAIIGSVRAEVNDKTVFIRKLIVHPTKQGQGIGTQLIYAIEIACPATRYELSASTRCPLTLELYERLGFVGFKEEQTSLDNGFIYLEKFCVG